MIRHRTSRNHTILLSFCFAIALLHTVFSLLYVREKIAIEGYSVLDYCNHNVSVFSSSNWDNGIEDLSMSLPVRVFGLLQKHTRLNQYVLITVFTFVQAYLFLFSVSLLSYSLFNDVRASIFTCILVLSTPFACLNLANFASMGFGRVLGHNYHWGFAFAFSFLFLNFFIQRRFFLCAIFLVLSMHCHLAIGVFAALFVLPAVIRNWKEYLTIRNVCIGVLSLIAVSSCLRFFFSSSISSSVFSDGEWLKMLRVFSFHHFPVLNQCFGIRAYKIVFPVIVSLVFFFYLIISKLYIGAKHEVVFQGVVFSLFLTALYVVFAEVFVVPSIVALQFHRMSYLVSFFATLYIGGHFFGIARASGWAGCLVASVVWVFLYLSRFGMPAAPFLLYLCVTIQAPKRMRYVGLVVLLLVLCLSFVYLYRVSLLYLLLADCDYKSVLLGVLLLAPILYFSRKLMGRTMLFCCMVLVLTVGFGKAYKHKQWVANHGVLAGSYLDVQQWALKSTSSTALFLVDPSFCSCGWRDISRRNKFGSLREWLFVPYARSRNSRYEQFVEGKKRARRFGVDFDALSSVEVANVRFHLNTSLLAVVKDRFYSMTPDSLFGLCQEYDVSHVVLLKEDIGKRQSVACSELFVVVYENSKFFVVTPLI